MLGDQADVELPVSPSLKDGYEVLRAALEYQLSLTLLPRQVLLVGSGNPVIGDTSFVHGVPQESTVAGVTYAQDKRVRRALLQRAGLTVPKGATFSIGRSAEGAVAFAEKVGYPIVVKPAMGDNTVGTMLDITDEDGLRGAIDYLHTPVDEREDFTRASYAMTELREPGYKDGKEVAPASYRFLIEKQLPGARLRLLLLNGKVRSAIWRGDETGSAEPQDVTEQLHPSINTLAARAADAVPGLRLVALDVVVPTWTEEISARQFSIVELSERAWLEVQAAVSEQLAASLADDMLVSGMRSQLVGQRVEEISTRVHIDGAVAPQRFADAFAQQAQRFGVQASLSVSDPGLGYIAGDVSGSARAIAWLLEQSLDEGIDGEKAMLAEVNIV